MHLAQCTPRLNPNYTYVQNTKRHWMNNSFSFSEWNWCGVDAYLAIFFIFQRGNGILTTSSWNFSHFFRSGYSKKIRLRTRKQVRKWDQIEIPIKIRKNPMLFSLRLAIIWHMDTRKCECAKTWQGVKPCINIKRDSMVN